MGFDLMNNFKAPYYAVSIKDFWDRWHISLSTWFRDYLYIPLGGNRCSKIKSIDLSSFKTTNAEKLSQMFYNCCSLEKLNISNFDFKEIFSGHTFCRFSLYTTKIVPNFSIGAKKLIFSLKKSNIARFYIYRYKQIWL